MNFRPNQLVGNEAYEVMIIHLTVALATKPTSFTFSSLISLVGFKLDLSELRFNTRNMLNRGYNKQKLELTVHNKYGT